MVDHGHEPVLHADALLGGPAHVAGHVDLLGECHRPPVLAAHQVEPLELDAEDERRPLDPVLLGGGHLLLALLALVHVLALAQGLPPGGGCLWFIYSVTSELPEVTLERRLYRVGLPDVQQQVHEVLESEESGGSGVTVGVSVSARRRLTWKVVETWRHLWQITSCLM